MLTWIGLVALQLAPFFSHLGSLEDNLAICYISEGRLTWEGEAEQEHKGGIRSLSCIVGGF